MKTGASFPGIAGPSPASALPPALIAGQATFDGCLAFCEFPGPDVQGVLPPGATLEAPDTGTSRLLIAFGEHSDGAAFLGGVPLPWGARYREVMIAVPFVRWGTSADAYLFILGMACDAWWAVWNGNLYYGFRKRLASLTWDGGRFAAVDAEGRTPFRASLGGSQGDAGADLTWIQSAASLPVLGRRSDGQFVESRFEWDFGRADVTAATVHLAIERHLPELPLVAPTEREQRACRVARMRWRISWPRPIRP